jgi:hypothetical protein
MTDRTLDCNTCPKGYAQEETKQVKCLVCPAGKYTDSVHECGVCKYAANKYTNAPGKAVCDTCPNRTFAYAGDAPDNSGGTACADDCPQELLGFSLGASLLQSHPRMQALNTGGEETAARQILRLETILEEVDTNGDDFLSRAEIMEGITLVEVSGTDAFRPALY